ncbi:MAG: tetratricopeptide repeat protein [Alphaproteobacteria bacterium]
MRKRAPAARAPAPSIAEKLVSAVRLHQAGALAEAEALYREVLAAEPRQADVLNQLGVVVHQTGRDDDALDLIDRAIAIDGSNPT